MRKSRQKVTHVYICIRKYQRYAHARSINLSVGRRSDKVPNLGLGPKWDQSAKNFLKGPKKVPILPPKSQISVLFQ